MSFDWDAWVREHQHPVAAKRVLDWLTKNEPEEITLAQARNHLVSLVCGVVDDCATYVERYEGTDFEMRERFK